MTIVKIRVINNDVESFNVFPLKDVEVLLSLLICDTKVFVSGAVDHVTAVHIIVDTVFNLGHQGLVVYAIEVN